MRAGADVELTAAEQADSAALDETALADVRKSLPGWDVQPFQLSRAADGPEGTDVLRAGLEEVAAQQGRAPGILVTGQHLVVRVCSEAVVGVTEQDVGLAIALGAVLTGSQATASNRTPG